MKYLEELKEMLCKELEEIANKGELTAGALDTVHKLTDTIKNIDKIEMLDEGGYSKAGGWEARGMYNDGMSYNEGGSSYARRKRNNMGRYSRDSHDEGHMRRGYSRDDAKGEMMDKLEEAMEEANSEKEREIIRHCMKQLENA